MIIECEGCPVRGTRCEDCMVTALLTPLSPEIPLDGAERSAASRFVSAGLLAPDAVAALRARPEPLRSRRAVG